MKYYGFEFTDATVGESVSDAKENFFKTYAGEGLKGLLDILFKYGKIKRISKKEFYNDE